MLTLEQIFEISAKHLLQQGRKSGPGGALGCYYRGSNFGGSNEYVGLQCAAGPFVKDGCPEGECFQSSKVARFWIDTFPGNDYIAVELVISLQHIHDWKDVAEWPEALAECYQTHFKKPYEGELCLSSKNSANPAE